MAHLGLPTPVVACELMDEKDRGAFARHLDVQAHLVVGLGPKAIELHLDI